MTGENHRSILHPNKHATAGADRGAATEGKYVQKKNLQCTAHDNIDTDNML